MGGSGELGFSGPVVGERVSKLARAYPRRPKAPPKQRKCIDKDYLDRRAQFSWPYLAGYADAEGYYQDKLRHQKAKRKNGSEYIGSSYCFGFVLTSNDIPSLTFIKERLMEAGYKFNKDKKFYY